MSVCGPLHLFEGFGVELEYMIVDRKTLDVLPVADELLKRVAGDYVSDVERDGIAWSNELVNHVIELKTNGPAAGLAGLEDKFQEDVAEINDLLVPLGGMLMPTAMHPWMDPLRETRLWAHEYNAVYEAYDRIFGCKGHGWSNLQSTHVNLPFCGDDEFGRLHAAIRLALPLIPALAASSPIVEGAVTGIIDNRMHLYEQNQRLIPSICNGVIPEPVYTEGDYRRGILERIWSDIAPYDTEGILREEFLNSRGAIARFGRGAIEIRVIDIQECPAADLAVVRAIAGLIQGLTEGRPVAVEKQKGAGAEVLKVAYDESVARGLEGGAGPLAGWLTGGGDGEELTFREVWRRLCGDGASSTELASLLGPGGDSLSARIIRALGVVPGEQSLPARGRIEEVYRELCRCLAEGRSFTP